MELKIKKHLFSYDFKTHKLLSTITISETENKIFNLILFILEKHNLKNVVCRVVGGWVRDKVIIH